MKISFTDNNDNLIETAFEDWLTLIKNTNAETIQTHEMNKIIDKHRDEIIQYLKRFYPEDFV